MFLDRDGTLIDDVGYLAEPNRIRVKEGVFDGVKRLLENGFIPVVLTNQSGVARGLIDRSTLQEIHRTLHRRFFEREAPIFGWYYCPHLPPDQLRPEEEDGAVHELLTRCDCRKPADGLWQQVLCDLSLDVDLSSSWSVGDRARDVEPGCELGTGGALLTDDSARSEHKEQLHVVHSFPAFVNVVLRNEGVTDG